MTRKEIARRSGCKVESFFLVGPDSFDVFEAVYSIVDWLGGDLEAAKSLSDEEWPKTKASIRRRAKAHPRLVAALADGLTGRNFPTEDAAWKAIEALL